MAKTFMINHKVKLAQYGLAVDVNITVPRASVHWGNNGIGSYEFWGAKCYDAGTDYIEEFEPEAITNAETDKPVSKRLFALLAEVLYDDEDFMRKLEEQVTEYEQELRAEAQLEARYSEPDISIFDKY